MEKYDGIILDAGHGGCDRGLRIEGLEEADMTLALVNQLAEKFEEMRIPVLKLRDRDDSWSWEERRQYLEVQLRNHSYLILSIQGTKDDTVHFVYSVRNQTFASLYCGESKTLPQNREVDYYPLLRDYPNRALIVYVPLSLERNRWETERIVSFVSSFLKPNGIPCEGISVCERCESLMIYQARKGENLYQIAACYGMKMEDLMDYNDMKDPFIERDCRIRIPGTEVSGYKVKENDNVYNVSQHCEIAKEELMVKNGITDGFLMYGQKIRI